MRKQFGINVWQIIRRRQEFGGTEKRVVSDALSTIKADFDSASTFVPLSRIAFNLISFANNHPSN